MEYPNSTLPLTPLPHHIRLWPILPAYLTQGDLEKNQAETTHQIWQKRPRAETTQAETTRAETTQDRNDSGTKRLRAETTLDRWG